MIERLLVAVDMDGTLLATATEDRLRPREIAALEAVRAAGHVVAICTGRNRQSLDSLLDLSGWHPTDLPKVLLNGAMVDAGAARGLLTHSVVPRPALDRIVALFLEHRAVPMVYAPDDAGGELMYQDGPVNEVLARYLAHRRDQVGALSCHDDLVAALPDAALEVGTIDHRQVIEPLTAAINAELAGTVRVINTRSLLGDGRFFWAEVYHKSCNKGAGVRLLAREFDIGPNAIVALGDNVNDLDMFAEATVSIAMRGGPDEVQAAADRLAAPVSESGAAEVLESIAEGRFVWPIPPAEESI